MKWFQKWKRRRQVKRRLKELGVLILEIQNKRLGYEAVHEYSLDAWSREAKRLRIELRLLR